MQHNNVTKFVEENMKTIFAYALSRVSNKEEAEDLAGDIILAILGSANKLKNDDALFGYVWAIANNTYKKYLQKKKRYAHTEYDENDIEDILLDEDFTEDICKREQINELRRELALLSKEYRECTIAYYMDGLSCQEAAKKLGISLEMVKYYLFKTRKILKEGIGMEREFGEKSYKPSAFEFITIFSGKFNVEYKNLFNRKLPGNILLSAYYTPMTIRELSIELGVSSAYMEDEVALLEKYNLLIPLPAGKYQTNLIIFTEGYMEEFYKCTEDICTESVGKMLKQVKVKLSEIRKVGFRGADLSDDRLLWPLLWLIMHRGYLLYDSQIDNGEELYSGENGVNYGVNFNQFCLEEYQCNSFAGYAKIDDSYAASGADFEILPKVNHYFGENEIKVKEAIYTGSNDYMICSKVQLSDVESVLKEQIKEMLELYEKMEVQGNKLMCVHAPKSVHSIVERVIKKTIFFNTVGLIGKCAMDSGALRIPEDDRPVAMFVYENELI